MERGRLSLPWVSVSTSPTRCLDPLTPGGVMGHLCDELLPIIFSTFHDTFCTHAQIAGTLKLSNIMVVVKNVFICQTEDKVELTSLLV